MALQVLIVDDDARLFELLSSYLEQNAVLARSAVDGQTALALLEKQPVDAVLLDVMMPGMDGLSVLRKIREKSDVPVIMLTAKGDETDRVVGLELGADDYLAKPFSPRELLARIKAIRRRNDRPGAQPLLAPSENELHYGPLTIDADKFRIHCQGREIILTAQEFKLLELLIKHPGRVFTRAQVLNRAWGDGGLVTDRTIDVHVKSLRKKFGKFEFIETVRGIGYRAREL